MAIIKCKMCGGDLEILPGATVAECEYCGSRQTVPAADDEKKLALFARANRLRASCEFDKASGIYESIVADFPEEAEAYWGLVLCKYGIEYVDDPASGKKIPTCHRSSFDSVMDDVNFDQALENADGIALKVYREEAKQIEEIRKGILAVSSNEQPYDIFICYKETDERGDRTVDSLLAQDIYDAVTVKGYRAFFSRITLEDKLGQAYEPYIFAALNSARIMLAVGTCYEYYNAVWVKNEWSRYLKIVAQDKNKYLIPCYKGIDAYDIPKEFAHLQGQDMGKVGAIQDLLRGIEKILPKQQNNTSVIQEKVVVSSSGDNKIASMLDRGYMALEDGDWAKADSFFEDVLNNDSKNAQAYLGKTLVQEKCCTIDAFISKRQGITQSVQGKKLSLEPNDAHVNEAAERYSLPGYVEHYEVRKYYTYDLSYYSEVEARRQQYKAEETYWTNHKQLSRAEKFAVGVVAENLAAEKKALFAVLSNRVKKAEAAEAAAKAKVQQAYEAHIVQADEKVAKLYQDGLQRREEKFQSLLLAAKNESDVKELRDVACQFEALGDYHDSKNLAEHCRKRAAEEQAKLDAEAERVRILKEKARKARKERNKKILLTCVATVAIVIAVVMFVTQFVVPNGKYKAAEALLEAGQYDNAAAAFIALGDFLDSPARAAEAAEAKLAAAYMAAEEFMAKGDYDSAFAAFEALGDYKDSAARAKETVDAKCSAAYLAAEELLAKGDYDSAFAAFEALGDYRDSAARAMEAVEAKCSAAYLAAELLFNDGKVAEAAIGFGKLGDYRDARERSLKCWDSGADREVISAGYNHTVALKPDGTVLTAGNNFYGLGEAKRWKDMIAVSAGFLSTIGLKANGEVVFLGSDSQKYMTNIKYWRNIVAISAGANHAVGLVAIGSVVALGDNYFGQCNVSGWTDIVAISAGDNHTVGLKADGTVVAVGHNADGQCNVSNWTDIIAISAGGVFTVGLKADGTVVAAGSTGSIWRTIKSWKDIVAISAGEGHVVGLKADGTVVAAGYNAYGQCNVSNWKNIVAISAGDNHTVGLKADGTMVAVGNNDDGQCDVQQWKNIKIP